MLNQEELGDLIGRELRFPDTPEGRKQANQAARRLQEEFRRYQLRGRTPPFSFGIGRDRKTGERVVSIARFEPSSESSKGKEPIEHVVEGRTVNPKKR